MKRYITIIIIALLTLIVGVLALMPFNKFIANTFGWQGHDDTRMFDFVFFVEWPILLIIGGIIGNWIYKKYLTNASNGQSKAS